MLALVVTSVYVHRYERRVELGAANVTVFVAARDLAAGTPGSELLSSNALVATAVPRRDVVPGAISSRAQIAKLVLAEKVYAREQITTHRFKPAAASGLRGELNGTMRALVVTGSADQLLAGLVREGDRVDAIAAIHYRTASGEERVAGKIVLRDLLVLRLPTAAAAGGGIGQKAGAQSIVLGLTDKQAQKLFLAMKSGDWSLALRPFGRSADTPVAVETPETLLAGGD